MYVCAPQSAPADISLGESEGDGLLVLAEEFGGTADGDCGSPRTRVKRCRRQGSRGANSKAGARPGR